MNNDPIDAKLSTDLSKIRERADAQKKLEEQAIAEKQKLAQDERVQRWNKKMNRAFRGITSRRVREGMLRAALKRAEAEEAKNA